MHRQALRQAAHAPQGGASSPGRGVSKGFVESFPMDPSDDPALTPTTAPATTANGGKDGGGDGGSTTGSVGSTASASQRWRTARSQRARAEAETISSRVAARRDPPRSSRSPWTAAGGGDTSATSRRAARRRAGGSSGSLADSRGSARGRSDSDGGSVGASSLVARTAERERERDGGATSPVSSVTGRSRGGSSTGRRSPATGSRRGSGSPTQAPAAFVAAGRDGYSRSGGGTSGVAPLDLGGSLRSPAASARDLSASRAAEREARLAAYRQGSPRIGSGSSSGLGAPPLQTGVATRSPTLFAARVKLWVTKLQGRVVVDRLRAAESLRRAVCTADVLDRAAADTVDMGVQAAAVGEGAVRVLADALRDVVDRAGLRFAARGDSASDAGRGFDGARPVSPAAPEPLDVEAASAYVWCLCAVVMDGQVKGGAVEGRNLVAKRQAARHGVLDMVVALFGAEGGRDDARLEDAGAAGAGGRADAPSLTEGCAWLVTWLTRWSSTKPTASAAPAPAPSLLPPPGSAVASASTSAASDDRAGAAVIAGMVPSLLGAVSAFLDDPKASAAASYALSQLFYASEQARVEGGHRVSTLVDALLSGDSSVCSNATTALGNLLITRGDFERRHEAFLESASALNHLVSTAHNSRGRSQQRAVMTLSFLAGNRGVHATLRRAGVDRALTSVAVSDPSFKDATGASTTGYAIEKATMGIAYLLGPEESATTLVVNTKAISMVVKRFKEAVVDGDEGFATARELAHALQLLAINDDNKRAMVDAGAVPVLEHCMRATQEDPLARAYAVLCVERLCFDASLHDALSGQAGLVDGLRAVADGALADALAGSGAGDGAHAPAGAAAPAGGEAFDATTVATTESSKEFRRRIARAPKYAQGALFMLGQRAPKMSGAAGGGGAAARDRAMGAGGAAPGGERRRSTVGDKHVMISYSWAYQKTVLALRDALRDAGYVVWLDVDEMAGSTLEAMASAVDNACLVLFTVGTAYKESANCRLEAEYAQTCKKDLIPLHMEKGYRANGWLGLILGSRLWHDFSGEPEEALARSLKPLIREMGGRGKSLQRRRSMRRSISAGSSDSEAAAGAAAGAGASAGAGAGAEAEAGTFGGGSSGGGDGVAVVRSPPMQTSPHGPSPLRAAVTHPDAVDDRGGESSGGGDASPPRPRPPGTAPPQRPSFTLTQQHHTPTAGSIPSGPIVVQAPPRTSPGGAGKASGAGSARSIMAVVRDANEGLSRYLSVDSSVEDVGDWLESLGMEEFADRFVEQRVCGRALAELLVLYRSGDTDACATTLRELGVVTVGERLRLMGALRVVYDDGDEPEDEA